MNYEELKSLLAEAEELINKGNCNEAETLSNKLLEKLEKLSEASNTQFARQKDELHSEALTTLSTSKRVGGDYHAALIHARVALDLAEMKNLSDETKAKAFGNIGTVYMNLSDYPQALVYSQKALAINEEIGRKKGIASNLGTIGSVYMNLSDNTQALSYFQKALAINEEIGSKNGIAGNLGSIGNVYLHLLDYAQALSYYQKALAIHEEIGNKDGIGGFLGNIGIVYANLSDYAKGLNYFQKALAIYEEIGDKKGIANNFGNIGQLLAMKQFDGYDAHKAEEYLQWAMAICQEIGEKNNLYTFYKTLADLYESQERWKEHSIQFKKYHNLKEEVQSEEAKKQAGLMEQRRQAAEREKEIEIANAAAEARLNATTSLLHRVLPESISTRMIEGEKNISDFFPSVSILFADIKGFTTISADMKAVDVVRFLNFVFGEFDRIMKIHGCEKIKTIGDGYMAVAGAPLECEDHAERLAAAALDIQQTILLPDEIRQTMPKGSQFGIRIGLHTGSVVAGVIGEERFVYDVHSDAVNIASRMESSGEVDRIHVSADFADHLQARYNETKNEASRFSFVSRGEMEIKGKGKMKTYFLNG